METNDESNKAPDDWKPSVDQLKRLEWFYSRYDVLASANFGTDSKQVFLGSQQDRVCRYCGNSEQGETKATFHDLAHAFPEQIGNKWLIDNQECDVCNKHFSKFLEDDFGKWANPWRTLWRVRGKGYSSYKSRDKKMNIKTTKEGQLVISVQGDDPRVIFNEKEKSIQIFLERQKYVPMGVFKCLVKMALAVMPPEEAAHCAHLKKWILSELHTFKSYPYTPLNIIARFTPGPLPNDKLSLVLIRRKEGQKDDESHPYMQFILSFSNLVFQIMLPMRVEDHRNLKKGLLQTEYWPNIWVHAEHEQLYGSSNVGIFDMSGTQKVQNDCPITMSFGTMTPIDPIEAEPIWRAHS